MEADEVIQDRVLRRLVVAALVWFGDVLICLDSRFPAVLLRWLDRHRASLSGLHRQPGPLDAFILAGFTLCLWRLVLVLCCWISLLELRVELQNLQRVPDVSRREMTSTGPGHPPAFLRLIYSGGKIQPAAGDPFRVSVVLWEPVVFLLALPALFARIPHRNQSMGSY